MGSLKLLGISAMIVVFMVSAQSSAGALTPETGDFASYEVTLSGSITQTYTFTLENNPSSGGLYQVKEIAGNVISTLNATQTQFYKVFPAVNIREANATTLELMQSPVNGYGFQPGYAGNLSSNFSNITGKRVTVPAGTYNAIQLNGTSFSSHNDSFSSVKLMAYVDNATGLILELEIQLDSNGTQITSYAQLLNTNIAQKAVSTDLTQILIVSVGAAVLALLLSLLYLQRKKD